MGYVSLIAAILGIVCSIPIVIAHIRIILKRKSIRKEQLLYSYKITIILLPAVAVLFLLNSIFYELEMNNVVNYQNIVGTIISFLIHIWPIFISLYFIKRWINKLESETHEK
jgi:large-conductance mechanosensitive channel